MRVFAWIFSVLLIAGGITVPTATFLAGGEFVSIPRLILFGVLPLCIAAVAFLAICKGDTMRKMLLVYGIAIVTALLGAEIYLAIQLQVATGRPTAAPTPSRLVNLDGIQAYPVACGVHFDLEQPRTRVHGQPVQPVTGVAHNLLNPEAGDRTTWRLTDQYGFNNPPGQWDGPPVPLAVVGDSFAFGVDVPIGKGFVDRLRERLGQVLNLGCRSNGPLLELASLVEYGPIVRPRVVVWAYYEGNDLTSNLSDELRSPILPRYLLPGFNQNLVGNGDELNRSIVHYLEVLMHGAGARPEAGSTNAAASQRAMPSSSKLFGIETLTLDTLRSALGLEYRLDPRMLEIFEQVLERAKTIVTGWGGRLIFVYLPSKSRYVSPLGKWDAAPYGRQVIGIAEHLGLPIIDIDAVFKTRPNPAALIDKHYTVEGYALVGDVIADELMLIDRS